MVDIKDCFFVMYFSFERVLVYSWRYHRFCGLYTICDKHLNHQDEGYLLYKVLYVHYVNFGKTMVSIHDSRGEWIIALSKQGYLLLTFHCNTCTYVAYLIQTQVVIHLSTVAVIATNIGGWSLLRVMVTIAYATLH